MEEHDQLRWSVRRLADAVRHLVEGEEVGCGDRRAVGIRHHDGDLVRDAADIDGFRVEPYASPPKKSWQIARICSSAAPPARSAVASTCHFPEQPLQSGPLELVVWVGVHPLTLPLSSDGATKRLGGEVSTHRARPSLGTGNRTSTHPARRVPDRLSARAARTLLSRASMRSSTGPPSSGSSRRSSTHRRTS